MVTAILPTDMGTGTGTVTAMATGMGMGTDTSTRGAPTTPSSRGTWAATCTAVLSWAHQPRPTVLDLPTIPLPTTGTQGMATAPPTTPTPATLSTNARPRPTLPSCTPALRTMAPTEKCTSHPTGPSRECNFCCN